MNRKEMIKLLKMGDSPLEVSIMKWEENRDTLANDVSPFTCALCCTQPILINCSTCIIFKHTKLGGCRGTPYSDYVKNPTKYNAGRMVTFLKSLRGD